MWLVLWDRHRRGPTCRRVALALWKNTRRARAPTDPSASVQVASALCCRLCRFRLVGALNSGGAVRAPAPPFLGGRGCAQEKQEALFSQTRGPALCQAAGEGGGGCLGMARSAPRPGTQDGFRECSRLPSLQQNLQPLWPPRIRRRRGPSRGWSGAVQTEPVRTSKAFPLTPVMAGRCHCCSTQRWCYCGQSVGVPSRAGAGHFTWRRKIDFLTSSHSLHVVAVVGVLLSHPHPCWCPLQLTRLVPGPLCGRPLASPSQPRSSCVRVLGYEMSTRKKQPGLGQDWGPQQPVAACCRQPGRAGQSHAPAAAAAVEPAGANVQTPTGSRFFHWPWPSARVPL